MRSIRINSASRQAGKWLMLAAFTSIVTAQVPASWPMSVRVWGDLQCDTEGRSGRCVLISAENHTTVALRSDGRLFANGQSGWLQSMVPPPPSGERYIGVAAREAYGMGILSGGAIVTWGLSGMPSAPPLPPGGRYVQVAAGGAHAVAMRSDGVLVAWTHPVGVIHGQAVIPPQLNPGSVAKISAGYQYTLALKHDGTIVAWGNNADGQCTVPILPSGVTYVDVNAGHRHAVALRSDGWVEAWGNNADGQCNVLPLPSGVTYELASAGWYHSAAYRSDGVFVTWGDQSLNQNEVPTLPAGDACIQLDSGNSHTVALLRSGRVLSWGYNGFLAAHVPRLVEDAHSPRVVSASTGGWHVLALTEKGGIVGWGRTDHGIDQVPPSVQGKRWLSVGCGELHNVALATDGSLVAWGDNSAGQCNVPTLPSGLSWTQVVVGPGHTVAMRSDGLTEGWGDNSWLCLPIPTPPAGLRYVDADLNYGTTLLLRSDNTIVHVGKPNSLGVPPPGAPSGLDIVEVATTDNRFGAALLSDGTVMHWGVPGIYWQATRPLPPPLPFGVSYVEIDSLRYEMVLRRSDGLVDMLGQQQSVIPALDPGTSYVGVSAGRNVVAARVGHTCTYVSFAPGCAGSRPATRLIPRDTPRIAKTLEVTLFDLPHDIAFLVFGWQRLPGPVDLGFLGMPGCNLHVSLDAIVPLVGQGQQAKWLLDIPNHPMWVGTRFYNQALVPDLAAGNAFGAVVSDAAEAVIGHW